VVSHLNFVILKHNRGRFVKNREDWSNNTQDIGNILWVLFSESHDQTAMTFLNINNDSSITHGKMHTATSVVG